MVLFLLTTLILLYIFYSRPLWGTGIIFATAFFHEWQIDFGQFSWSRSLPFLSTLNAPVVDFVALIALVALVLAVVTRKLRLRKISRKYFPIIFAYLAFVALGALSTLSAFDHNTSVSLKFLLRFEVFTFLAYLIYPIYFIDSEPKIKSITQIITGVGIFTVLFGVVSALSSYFSGTSLNFWRIVPVGFFGFAPFGTNHNLLAEALTVAWPFVLWPAIRTRSVLMRYLVLIFAITALLTLSRAAWVSFVVILGLVFYEHRFALRNYYRQQQSRFNTAIVVALVVLIGYMGYFLTTSSVVTSSNYARFEVTRMVAFYSARAPFFGYGPGMFMPILLDTTAYGLQFGDPLEAHGFIQKIILENGLFGLVAFFTFIISIFAVARKFDVRSEYFSPARASAVGIIVFELFNTSYFSSVMFLPIGFMLAILLLYEKN